MPSQCWTDFSPGSFASVIPYCCNLYFQNRRFTPVRSPAIVARQVSHTTSRSNVGNRMSQTAVRHHCAAEKFKCSFTALSINPETIRLSVFLSGGHNGKRLLSEHGNRRIGQFDIIGNSTQGFVCSFRGNDGMTVPCSACFQSEDVRNPLSIRDHHQQ